MSCLYELCIIILPIILSIVGLIIALIGLIIALRVFKIEKQLNQLNTHADILEKYKHILILQMVYFSDEGAIKGYDALELVKKNMHLQDDFKALEYYYMNNNS